MQDLQDSFIDFTKVCYCSTNVFTNVYLFIHNINCLLLSEFSNAHMCIVYTLNKLNWFLQDSCYHVRMKFAEKLHKGLFSLKLPLEFMSIFSLAANDPVRERRTAIKRFIQLNIQRRRDFLKQNPPLGGNSVC